MKYLKYLLISAALFISQKAFSQQLKDTIGIKEVDFDSIDVGINHFSFPDESVKKKFLHRKKYEVENYYLIFSFINKGQTRKLKCFMSMTGINTGFRVYAVNLHKRKYNSNIIKLDDLDFSTNHFGFKIGDDFDNALVKLKGLPIVIDSTEKMNKNYIVRISGIIKGKKGNEFFINNSQYEAIYVFEEKKLSYIKIMFY